jgi:signal transduction histidine kinase
VLHPPLLDEAGLAAAVPWYTSGFAERSGIRVQLDRHEDFPRSPLNVEMALFRALQECLINIHRHSRCSLPKISFVRSGSQAVLEVTDDGRGMPESFGRQAAHGKAPLGVGLAGMRERVEQLGGQIKIESTPGQGTTVRVTLPAGDAPGT